MKLGKVGNQIGQAVTAYKQAQFFGVVALWILGWFAISVQVFTRKGFGERYMSVLNIFFGLSAIGFFTGIGNVILSAASNQSFSALMEVLYFTAIGLSIFHRVTIWMKNRRKVIWHSMYSGVPLLSFTGLDEGTLKRWVEPMILFTLGYFASHAHQTPVATWLYIGAFAVFVHETLSEYMARAAELDSRDAWIEANYRSSILAGKRAQREHGFSMSKSSVELMRQTPEVTGELPEDVRNIMDPEVVG